MKTLKQNNLENSTTGIGFVKSINENANELSTDKIALIREVELDDNIVKVEGITPHKMKSILNQQILASGGDSKVSFKTPGEPVQVYADSNKIGPVETQILDGVVQLYNKNMDESAITGINLKLVEGLREGEDNVEANAIIGTLTFTGTSSDVTYSLDETNDYSSFMIDNKNLKVKGSPLTSKTYNITINATSGEDIETKSFEIEVLEAYPEITNVTLDKTSGLREGESNVNTGATVATLTTVGGTQPFTYTIGGTDASSFVIAENKLNVKSNPLTAKTYNITITSTDKNSKTKTVSDTIVVQAAYPEITSFTISPKSGLIHGNANVQADAIVATMSVEGGSNPITYSLREDASNGIDNSSFKVDGANLKVNTTPLVTKNYKVALRATDVHGKIKDQNAIIEVSAPEITTLTITPVNSLTAPVAADTVVANLSTQGGISPYTYSLKASTGDNAEFKIENDTVKNISSIDSEATKSITVIVTDVNNKTKEQTAQITVNAAG